MVLIQFSRESERRIVIKHPIRPKCSIPWWNSTCVVDKNRQRNIRRNGNLKHFHFSGLVAFSLVACVDFNLQWYSLPKIPLATAYYHWGFNLFVLSVRAEAILVNIALQELHRIKSHFTHIIGNGVFHQIYRISSRIANGVAMVAKNIHFWEIHMKLHVSIEWQTNSKVDFTGIVAQFWKKESPESMLFLGVAHFVFSVQFFCCSSHFTI